MKKHITALFAQSPVHVGAGNSVGAVDMPVVRERHTRIPVIPGSALKGVLSTFWGNRREKGSDAYHLFGGEDAKEASAGQLLIGEARVLAFPVRSARKSFAWVTSPLALLLDGNAMPGWSSLFRIFQAMKNAERIRLFCWMETRFLKSIFLNHQGIV